MVGQTVEVHTYKRFGEPVKFSQKQEVTSRVHTIPNVPTRDKTCDPSQLYVSVHLFISCDQFFTDSPANDVAPPPPCGLLVAGIIVICSLNTSLYCPPYHYIP